MPLVIAGDHDPAHRIPDTLHRAATGRTQRVVARILMRQRRHDELHPIILARLVYERMPQVAPVPNATLAKLRSRIGRLTLKCKPGRQYKGRVVEAVL